jgi:cell division protein FtsQ
MQQVRSTTGPRSARTLPGMPLEAHDPDEDDVPRRKRQFETPSGPWWRPTTTFGRIVLGTCAFLSLSGFIISYVLARRALLRDARFRIASTQNVQAVGLGEVTRADILPVFGDDIGRNIFFVHLSDRRKQLEKIPWVQSATVERFLPDQIRVAVVERTPIAFVRQGQRIGLVDSEGVLLDMPPAGMTQHHYSFPVITGIDARDPQPSRRARMAVYQRLIGELDANGQHISDQISEIDLTDPEDARVLMPEQGNDILADFGDEQFMQRYQRYKTHIAEWRQQYPHLASVDLRYDQQVVLQMAPGTSTDQLAVSAADGKPAANSESPKAPPTKAPAKSAAKPHPAAPAHGKSHPHATVARAKKKHVELNHAAHSKPVSRTAPLRQGQ